MRFRHSEDGRFYEVVWPSQVTQLPITVVARLDASAIGLELLAFVFRIIGLILLISAFVCAVTLSILGHQVLLPVLRLRDQLLAAEKDPQNAERYILGERRNDELGEAMGAVDRVFARVSRMHREEIAIMSAVTDQAMDAILAYDGNGKVVLANHACLKLCGYENSEEMVRAGVPRIRFPGASRDVCIPESLSGGAYSREAVLISRGKAETPVFINAARPQAGSYAVIRYYASITDISERHAAERRLETKNLELQGANRAKSEFLALMSHELRTPLNAIIGFSEVMRSGILGGIGNPRYEEYVGDIHDSGKHLLSVINDILNLSKIESGQMDLENAVIDIAELVDSILPMVRQHADSKGLILKVSIANPLPGLTADPRAVKQILINLLSNSIKFTETGGVVEISAWLEDGAIVMSISDTGAGIPKDQLKAVLEPFVQIQSAWNAKHEGTGLGLPIVKSLVALHNGTFTLASEAGAGTTVTIRFPSERAMTPPDRNSADAVTQESASARSIA